MPPTRKPAGRFLAPGQGNGHGYKTRPLRDLPAVADQPEVVDRIRAATSLRDEPEAIGPRWLRDWAETAELHRSQQHAVEVAAAQALRPRLDAEDRLRDIRRRAKRAHVDLSRECHLAHRDIERARAGGRTPPRRALDRIQGLEALLDGIAA